MVIKEDGQFSVAKVHPDKRCALTDTAATAQRQIWLSSDVVLEERLAHRASVGAVALDDARAACEAVGGSLPMIRTPEELVAAQGWCPNSRSYQVFTSAAQRLGSEV